MFDDRTPIYRQIAGQLREDIVSRLLDDDEHVMSTNQYATFHRINPATVAKAVQELVDDGLLDKRRGLGMFVTPGGRERLRADRRARFFDDVLAPMIDEARRLDIPDDDVIDRHPHAIARRERPDCTMAVIAFPGHATCSPRSCWPLRRSHQCGGAPMTLNIEVRDLSVHFGETRAVDDITFDLAGGTVVGLLVRNGGHLADGGE